MISFCTYITLNFTNILKKIPNWWTEYHCQCKTVDMGLGHHAGIKYCGCAEIFNEATCKATTSFGIATRNPWVSDELKIFH